MIADYNQPVNSQWNNADAARCQNELALRAYGSRLLGGDPSLVLHGGGNTSIKLEERGDTILYVKGTGSNLATVDERAFTPLRLDGVSTLLELPELDNARMMHELDTCLAHRPAPRPSIETLLHAGLPFRCVEHTHADAVLAAMNVENIDAVHAEVYGARAPLVPYHHSGHALARACLQVFHAQRTRDTIGLILAFHGVVAFGGSVIESYENMIELVTRAEHFLQSQGAWEIPTAAPSSVAANTGMLKDVHAAISAAAGVPMVLHINSSAQCVAFARREDLAEITCHGPATPQHAVYTKRVPMIGREAAAVHDFATSYRQYLDTHLGKSAGAQMDPAPRIVLDADFGVCAFGATARDAAMAAEMFEHDIAIISRASAHGRYRSAPPAAIALAEFEYGGFAANPVKK